MDFASQLEELQSSAMEGILEPERVESFTYYLQQAGFHAEVDWIPEKLMDAHAGADQCLMGIVRLHDSPIARIELRKSTGSVRGRSLSRRVGLSTQRTMYNDHFLIDAPPDAPSVSVRVSREENRKYWLFGPIVGYSWKGGQLADQLESDTKLNQVLDATGEKRIYNHFDRENGVMRMTRPYRPASVIGVHIPNLTHNVGIRVAIPDSLRSILRNSGEASKEFGFPTPNAVRAYERIAAHIRQAAGLPAR